MEACDAQRFALLCHEGIGTFRSTGETDVFGIKLLF